MTRVRVPASPQRSPEELLCRLRELVASPSSASWRKIARMLDGIGDAAAPELTIRVQETLAPLASWPREISRESPQSGRWPESWRAVALHRVLEQDTYQYYIRCVCTDPRLRLGDGRQAVRLERRTVGTHLAHDGSRYVRVGQVGEADLSGSLAVDVPGWEAPLCVPLHVEVKGTSTRVSAEQLKRAAALERRGEICLIVRGVEECVLRIIAERERIGEQISSLRACESKA